MRNNYSGEKMNFEVLFVIGVLISIAELFVIHFFSAKKFELTFVDGAPVAIMYTCYFFLPFTIKANKYKNLQKAFVRDRLKETKKSTYKVYDIFLKFPDKTIVLLKDEFSDEEALKKCENINKAIASSEEYCLGEISVKDKAGQLLSLFCLLAVIMFVPLINRHTGYFDSEKMIRNLYVFLFATGIVVNFCLISFIVNAFIGMFDKRKKNDLASCNDSDTDIDLEAKKIDDFLIK